MPLSRSSESFGEKRNANIVIRFSAPECVKVETVSSLCGLRPQLVPYVGEELVSVKVEPCSPAVIQERKEVLEVCHCLLFTLARIGESAFDSSFNNVCYLINSLKIDH